MAGAEKIDDPNLKGLWRYFNNETIRGRANVAKLTLSVIGLIMAGQELLDDPNLKGLWRYFNNETIRGRANVAKLTLGSVGLIGLYFYLKPKKTPAAPTPAAPTPAAT